MVAKSCKARVRGALLGTVVPRSRARSVDRFEIELDGERLVVVSLPVVTDRDILAGLTRSEAAVALDAVAGLSNTAIAKKRKRAVRTVANQLASVYRKLGVASRAELTVYLQKKR